MVLSSANQQRNSEASLAVTEDKVLYSTCMLGMSGRGRAA